MDPVGPVARPEYRWVQRLVFGSSASRTESPRRLKAMTKITIDAPGKSMNVMSLW